MEGFDVEVDSIADLRVNSTADLRVSVSDEEGIVGARVATGSIVGSMARSVPRIVTARAPVVADASWHHELAGRGGTKAPW